MYAVLWWAWHWVTQADLPLVSWNLIKILRVSFFRTCSPPWKAKAFCFSKCFFFAKNLYFSDTNSGICTEAVIFYWNIWFPALLCWIKAIQILQDSPAMNQWCFLMNIAPFLSFTEKRLIMSLWISQSNKIQHIFQRKQKGWAGSWELTTSTDLLCFSALEWDKVQETKEM